MKQQIEELNKGKQTKTREERQQQRSAYTTKLQSVYGSGIGKMMDEMVAQEKALGGFIPDFVLQDKWNDPVTGKETGVSNLAMTIKTEFDKKVDSLPGVRAKKAELQMLPPGPESEAVAAAYYADLRAKYLPPIIKAHIKRVQDGILKSQTQRQQVRQQQGQIAGIEPRSTSTPQVQPQTDDQMNKAAAANAAKRPEYADATPGERLEMEIEERYKLRGLTA